MRTFFRTTLRARLGLACCHDVSYPRGVEYFKALRPLSKSQRAQLVRHRLDAAIAASEAKQARIDKAIVWLFGAALVCLYSALDYGLSSWLLGF